MGNTPHWTKTVYIIERVLQGKRATRYLVEGKKGAFLRGELQKVAPVTKKDPRVAKKAKQQEVKEKLDERKPPPFRHSKYVSKFVYIKVSGEKKDRRALLVSGHRDFALLLSRQKVLIRSKNEIVRFTSEKIGGSKDSGNSTKKVMDGLLQKHADALTAARKRIDDFLNGDTARI